MVETLIATVVYGLLFYVVFLGRVFDAGKFGKGTY
jgi:hypothetical protein